jgi:hypothetical protein
LIQDQSGEELRRKELAMNSTTDQNEMDRRTGRIMRLAGELPTPLPRDRQFAHDRSLADYDRALGEGRN